MSQHPNFKVALDELHAIGLLHNDVRLPNICFNEQFEPALVDIDRCWNVILIFLLVFMAVHIARTGKKTDYVRPAWMVGSVGFG